MSDRRPSVTIRTALIEKFTDSDFDTIYGVEARVAAIETIIDAIDNLDLAIDAANSIAELLAGIGSTYVTAPLLDNAVDYSAEGFAETELGAFLSALALIVKLNEIAVADNLTAIAAAATPEGTSYVPAGGNFSGSLTNVKLVLDSLRSLFARSGTLVIANDAAVLNYTSVGNQVDVPNDLAGTDTDNTYAPGGVTSVYTGSDEFDFSELNVGDAITLKVDIDLVTTASDQVAELFFVTAEGTATEKAHPITRQSFASAGTYTNVVGEVTIHVNHADIPSNPGHITFKSGSNATVTVNEFTMFANVKDS